MKQFTKNYNYNDPVDIAEAFERAKQNQMLNNSTNDNIIEESDDKSDDTDNNDKDELTKAKPNNYFFKNILFFTNNTNKEKNKTLNNLYDAVKYSNVNVYPFDINNIEYHTKNDKIYFNDTESDFIIDKQSNIDTIVICRLGVQDSEECIELVKELQAWGLFVLNPIQAAKKASNKYTTAVLLDRYNIPQPKFTLLNINDIKDELKSLNKKLKLIYDNIDEEDHNNEYVIKILNGHGGTGVFMVNDKNILSVLQTIFAIDPERELLLQKKEDAEGGDIRVHVLTLRTQQKILAAMKRNKLGKDFRSNVSLGASVEKVQLTPEQENIALSTAKISGMPWCAVDIMPLKDGSNVVLEFNASPGTEGISDAIGENFITILLDNINDINELVLEPHAIGYIENVYFMFDDSNKEVEFEAKFDTGNGAIASTIGCEKVSINDDTITATILGKEYEFEYAGESNPTVGQSKEKRYVATIPQLRIGHRKLINCKFALVDNRNKKQKILINRDVMSKMGYLINPNNKHILNDHIIYDYKYQEDKNKDE